MQRSVKMWFAAIGDQFLGCSHYPGCNQTFSNIDILEQNYLCPACKSGFMTKKTKKYWNFLGCTNFPVCRKTINLQNDSRR